MRFLTTFSESFLQAVDYYAAIDSKLARRFIETVDRAQRKIAQFPKLGKPAKNYRALLLQEFPYSICYREDLDGEFVALVLFHHKQKKPGIE